MNTMPQTDENPEELSVIITVSYTQCFCKKEPFYFFHNRVE